MTKTSIQKAFTALRSDAEMKPLEAAARSRSEADWLVGINGTRALTAFNSKDGGFFLTTVGRVQTPTLAIVVAREEEIAHFKPQNYWEVHATFGAQAGDYDSVWVDADFKKRRVNLRSSNQNVFGLLPKRKPLSLNVRASSVLSQITSAGRPLLLLRFLI